MAILFKLRRKQTAILRGKIQFEYSITRDFSSSCTLHPARLNSRFLSLPPDKQHLQQLLSSPISKPPLAAPPLQSSPLLPNHQPAPAAAAAVASPSPSPDGGGVSAAAAAAAASGAKADESKTTTSAPTASASSSSSGNSGGDKKINNNTTSYVSGGGRLKFFKGMTTTHCAQWSRIGREVEGWGHWLVEPCKSLVSILKDFPFIPTMHIEWGVLSVERF